MGRRILTRFYAVFLVLALCVGMNPLTALAADGDGAQEAAESSQTTPADTERADSTPTSGSEATSESTSTPTASTDASSSSEAADSAPAESTSASSDSGSDSVNSDSIPASTLEEDKPTDGFVALALADETSVLQAAIGDAVTFSVTLNRTDIAVTYQWQRLGAATIDGDVSLGEALYPYGEDESTSYAFLIDDKTEAEVLADNPDAAWPGIEMYYDQLEKAGGDASKVHIENGTPNYILDPVAAAEADGVAVEESAWADIDGANAPTYNHTVAEADRGAFYRCVITITDSVYLAELRMHNGGSASDTTVVSSSTSASASTSNNDSTSDSDSTSASASHSNADSSESESSTLPDNAVVTETFMSDGMYIDIPTSAELAEEDAALKAMAVASIPVGVGAGLFAHPENPAVSLSSDNQWVVGVNANMEYITETAYNNYGGDAANNAYWTKLSGGTRPDGTKYTALQLTDSSKLEVASAWYGKRVYFRMQGASGTGTTLTIPAYTSQDFQSGTQYLYKSAIKVMNAWVTDTGGSYYANYINTLTSSTGYIGVNHITVQTISLDTFNRNAESVLKDAEGNYIFDLVVVGVCTNDEPDISGAAAWALQRYITEGYGFLIGHDTMYGYGGVTASSYVPDASSTITPYYVINTKNNGHWNMNWLMGVNATYNQASPYNAASMILDIGDYTDKTAMYGDNEGSSTLRIASTVAGNPASDPTVRCPTNYPYSTAESGDAFSVGATFHATATHTNQQIAYGKVWIDYASNSLTSMGLGRLVTDNRNGLTGTNNFYLTTNGNFGMSQMGHIRTNYNYVNANERRILANTIFYLSQRQQCQVCQSEQGNNQTIHYVHRISSAEQLEALADQTHNWFTYPTDGCYMLTQDITLPSSWTPITGFYGHFDADGHTVTSPNGQPLFANTTGALGQYTESTDRGWNLGTDKTLGLNSVYSTSGQRTTGIARVSGYLADLFNTGTSVDWGGKIVVVDGTDGQSYWCLTNIDGKYVISNTPCTGIMHAHVYNTSDINSISAANEVTQYGLIRVNVPAEFWDVDETTPLYLLGLTPIPVENRTVYEEQDANFVQGGVYWTSAATNIVWQYKPTAASGWSNVAGNGIFSYEIGSPDFHDLGEDSYTLTSLKVKNCAQSLSGYYFRAVFTINGKTLATSDVSVAGKEGLLTVLPRPAYVKQAADTTVWTGADASFTSYIEFWKQQSDGLTIKWQYRENTGTIWKNLTSLFTTEITTAESTAEQDTNLAPYRTSTTLKIKECNRYWSGYQYRAVYTYTDPVTGVSTSWYSDKYNEAGYTGTLTVRPPEITVTDPGDQTVNVALGESVSTETATYTSVVKYSPSTSNPTIEWVYNTYHDLSVKSWTQDAATALYPSSGITVSTSQTAPVAVAGEDNTYQITATMTITNAPVEMDLNEMKFRFGCKATNIYDDRAISGFGQLNITYPIDINHNASVNVLNANGSATYTYPELDVIAPDATLLHTMVVRFVSESCDSRDSISYSNLPAGVTVAGDSKKYTFHIAAGLTAAEWETWLRANTSFNVYETSADIYWYKIQYAALPS